MSNRDRLRVDFLKGEISDAPLIEGSNTINSPDFVNLPVVDATNSLILVLDPQSENGNGTEEVVLVTAHAAAATAVTVQRDYAGTGVLEHPYQTKWWHGPYSGDYSKRVNKTAVALGTVANDNQWDWFEVPLVCRRGLMSHFEVTPTVLADTIFDVEIWSGAAGTDERFLGATSVNGSAYKVTAPVYIEGDNNASIYVGIKHASAGGNRTFNLTRIRVEAFL